MSRREDLLNAHFSSLISRKPYEAEPQTGLTFSASPENAGLRLGLAQRNCCAVCAVKFDLLMENTYLLFVLFSKMSMLNRLVIRSGFLTANQLIKHRLKPCSQDNPSKGTSCEWPA